MPLVRFAFTNVFFKGDRTFLLFSKSNKPLFRTWPSGQGSKELCGTGEILSGLCRHQVATKRVLTNAYCVIDADYNNLTIHSTQYVINAHSPMLIVPSMHNTQAASHSVSKVEKTVFSWGISYFFG